jgi:hypothetical protein
MQVVKIRRKQIKIKFTHLYFQFLSKISYSNNKMISIIIVINFS